MTTQTIEGGGLTIVVRRLTRGDKVLIRFPLMRKFLPDKPDDDDSPESFLYTEKWNFICMSSQSQIVQSTQLPSDFLVTPKDTQAEFDNKFAVYLELDDSLIERWIAATNSFDAPVGEAHTTPEVAKDADPS